MFMRLFKDYINMSHSLIQDNVTISEDCANGQDIRANYELSYTTNSGTLNTTCVVNGRECSNSACRHVLQSNTADSRCQPRVSQFSRENVTVSVTGRNIVGRSNPAVSRSISEIILEVKITCLKSNIASIKTPLILAEEWK